MADTEAAPDEEARPQNAVSRFATKVHERLGSLFDDHPRAWKWVWMALLHAVIIIHFICATVYFSRYVYPDWDWELGYGLLILFVLFVYVITVYLYLYKPFLQETTEQAVVQPTGEALKRIFDRRWLQWACYLVVLFAILVYLIIDTWSDKNRLVAIVGFFTIVLVGAVFSKYPGDIRARPIFCGLFVQFFLGLIIIKWSTGREVFRVLGSKVSTFLEYTDDGSSFAFGEGLVRPIPTFAFKAMSVIFFLSFMVQVLYYYGVIQRVVLVLGTALQRIMGTTITESVNAAANIFMGMTESPLLFQPYLETLTNSELHAVIAAGFASVAGTVLAAYVSYGARADHLITASVLSAPAALCYSKLFYPETEPSRSTADTIVMPQSDAQGVLDAACRGASDGIALVLGIVANVIAFLTFVSFVNATCAWFGSLVGYPHATPERALAYVFMPVSFLMGVPWNESLLVGQLIATKTMVNEFVAYANLGKLKHSPADDNETEPHVVLTKRAEAIATYAICGFSNPGSVGIMISGMSILAPSRRDDVMKVIWRSFLSGIMACFLTACVAGILMRDEDL